MKRTVEFREHRDYTIHHSRMSRHHVVPGEPGHQRRQKLLHPLQTVYPVVLVHHSFFFVMCLSLYRSSARRKTIEQDLSIFLGVDKARETAATIAAATTVLMTAIWMCTFLRVLAAVWLGVTSLFGAPKCFVQKVQRKESFCRITKYPIVNVTVSKPSWLYKELCWLVVQFKQDPSWPCQ